MNETLEQTLRDYSEVKERVADLKSKLEFVPAYKELHACEERLAVIKKDIINQSQENYEVSVNNTHFKFTKYVSNVFDTKLFKLEQPEMATKYVKVLTKKVLSVK